MSKESNIYDLIIIGAGFAGLYSLYKAIKRNIKVCVFEKQKLPKKYESFKTNKN